MYEITQALFDFWNSFGINAYSEDDPRLADSDIPRLVYRIQNGETFSQMPDYVNMYYSNRQRALAVQKADEIRERIGGGITLRLASGGNIVIHQITWQMRPDTADTIALYGSFSVDYNLL